MSDFLAPGPLLYPSHHAASLKVHYVAWELSLIFPRDGKYAMETWDVDKTWKGKLNLSLLWVGENSAMEPPKSADKDVTVLLLILV